MDISSCYKVRVLAINKAPDKSGTQPAGLRKKGVVTFVMLVWLVYWAGMFFQTCCQPQLQVGHEHLSGIAAHDEHHDDQVAAHDHHDTTTEHEHCTELKSADLVPAPAVALMRSTAQPLLIASHRVIFPEPVFSIATSHTLSQQTHPPPNRFLRTRRLLI